MMEKISLDDERLKYPGFFNIYPIQNEMSMSATTNSTAKNEFWLDDFYGRIISNKVHNTYGNSQILGDYKTAKDNIAIEHLRVPFRKIPIFKYENMAQISLLINEITKENPDYEILLRGQTKQYTINRTEEEKLFLYGEKNPIEPSFQPSFIRSNFNEFFIYSLWHSQTALLLNDIGIDLSKILLDIDFEIFKKDVINIKLSPDFTPISLGFAQHYGLPSIGLDLTKSIKVATWFASHKMNIDEQGSTTITDLEDFSESTIYIFRCPKDSVFSHQMIKPKYINNTRPDRQDAWFGHVGWGCAKNQLASYLVCGVRLDETVLNLYDQNYADYLFPSKTEDLVLDYFMNVKNNSKYKGEVERALKKLYYLMSS